MDEHNEVTFPDVEMITSEDFEDTSIKLLTPKQQRFMHLYLSGGYTISQIAKLLNMSYSGVWAWLSKPNVKETITKFQQEEDVLVSQGIKALRLKAMYKMGDLLDSNIDGIAYQAARDILDRTGHKAPTKQEVSIEVKTFEQQLIEIINNTDNIVDAEFKTIESEDTKAND